MEQDKNRVIVPKVLVDKIEYPIIFLAGPTLGAPNWRVDAIHLILSEEPNLVIASPTRDNREISGYLMSGEANYFPRQRAWERYYLDLAARTGAILFWLPGEVIHNPRKVYGATTRLELGQWMTNYKHDRTVSFCVGSDGNFPDLDVIKYDLSIDAPDKEIRSSLIETCKEAVRLAES
jgi:hypothetical protein